MLVLGQAREDRLRAVLSHLLLASAAGLHGQLFALARVGPPAAF